MDSCNRKIALNYIHLSKSHAGGKDQVGLNLLKGFYGLGKTKEMAVICYDYSIDTIKSIAPDVQIISIKNKDTKNELERMALVCLTGTLIIPKLITRYKIDVIYHLNCNNGLVKLKAESIVIPHDIKAVAHRVLANVKIPYYKYILYKIMYSMDFRHADKIIAISDFDKKEMLMYYGKYENKIIRIYNPVMAGEVNKDTQCKDKYVCALNLQFHHKNIITLIKAFEIIKDKVNFKLLLIGGVPKRVEYLKEYVKEHNLGECIIFTGFVSDEKLEYLFQNSSLYINPTLYEGFGMTAVEAMMKKIPTLISDIPANVEVTKGLCSYYGPAQDEHILADKIIECLERTYTDEELEKNRQAMLEEYSCLEISRQYIKLFGIEV